MNDREHRIKEAENIVASLRDNPDSEFFVAVGGNINGGKRIGLKIAVGMSPSAAICIASLIFRELPLEGKRILAARIKEDAKIKCRKAGGEV